MSEQIKFVDIMSPKRNDAAIYHFMTRPWHPQMTQILDKIYTPQELKDATANSPFMDTLIEAECVRTGVHKEKLKKEVLKYLEEMGLQKKQFVIRWMGVFFLKISYRMKIGVFVNEVAALKVRSSMGKNPLLFLPTHRSYADFCLMTYLCYHYDIDFPAVAAGLDFYDMTIIGRCIRDTCGFYIRRTLAGDHLYAGTLKQYVRTLVTKHCAPIEFFLEGTRSRSNKSLPPKYGMLSMALAPLFTGEVFDVTIVPVNISYDRLMEHGLFAYEHLGVPKPKESTGSMIKALRALNDNFGNIYINFGEPITVREYIKRCKTYPDELLKPLALQQLTPDQFGLVQDLASDVICQQQDATVATISNLLAILLMESIIKNKPLPSDEVLKKLESIICVLRSLGAKVFENDVKHSLDSILIVHNKTIKMEKSLKLIASLPMEISSVVKKKMKGHTLKSETMVNAVPIIQLQLYVNPVLHYFVSPAIVTLIVLRGPIGYDRLKEDYTSLRTMLRHEFFYLEKNEDEKLRFTLEYCINHNLVHKSEMYTAGGGSDLQFLMRWLIWPTLTTIIKCADVMIEQNTCEHKQAMKLIQERVESSQCHPYCLSLDAISNCLQGLVLTGALVKNKIKENVNYQLNHSAMEKSYRLVTSVLPKLTADFSKNNTVILDQRFQARL